MAQKLKRVNSFLDKFRKEKFKFENVKDCWNHYDEKGTGRISIGQVKTFLKDLFVHHEQEYTLSTKEEEYILNLLQVTEDDQVTFEDFQLWWGFWLRDVLNPVSALIIVDVQNDFIDGSLALKNCPAKDDGADVVPVINSMRNVPFDVVALTKDWHSRDHCSFYSNLDKYELDKSSKIKKEEAKLFDVVSLKEPRTTDQKALARPLYSRILGSRIS